ncbi:MAG: holo-ACP synthase [Actinomycetota bacterium]
MRPDRLRVGVDLVEVDRFARALERWPGLRERVFTASELAECAGARNTSERLAARFAAKEAAFKALGRGWPDLAYRDVEVRSEGGAPALRLRADAAALVGDRDVAVSLSHTGGFALAQVVMTSS